MATVYVLWSRNKGQIVGGPYPSSADATAAAAMLKGKSPQSAGVGGHYVADTFDVLTVTKN